MVPVVVKYRSLQLPASALFEGGCGGRMATGHSLTTPGAQLRWRGFHVVHRSRTM